MAKRKQQPIDKPTLAATRPAEIAQAFNDGDLKRFYDEWHKLRGLMADSPDLLAQAEHAIAFAITDEGTSEASRLGAFREVLKVNPYQMPIYGALNDVGICLTKLEHHHTAITKYRQALNYKPNDYLVLTNYATTLLQLGKYEDAISKYKKVFELKPDYVEMLNGYGNALNDLEQYDEAITKLEQALRIEPNYVHALNNYGNALSGLGRYDEAITNYKQALKFDPNYIYAWNGYGNALNDLGKYNEAIVKFEGALKLAPNYVYALNGYGNTLNNLGRYQESIAKYEYALKLKPNNHEVLNNYGIVLSNLKRYNESIANYELALSFKPEFVQIWLNYGQALIELRKYKEAIEKFEHALNTPNAQKFTNYLYLQLGLLYYKVQQDSQAKYYFNQLLEISDDKDKQKIELAEEMLAIRYGSDEALDMLEEVLETSPHYAKSRQWLARTATGKRFFDLFRGDSSIKDTESLNRAMYHKIGNEVAVLRSIVDRIKYLSPTPHELLGQISQQLEQLPAMIKERRERGQQEIQAANFGHVLQAISAVAHDVSDLVNNELAVIESKTRRLLLTLADNDPAKVQFEKLLTQVKFTQIALNDLKAVNEGITIKASRFPVKTLFEKWVLQPQIGNATVTVTLDNGEEIFNGDAEKIKSAINELVENSLKHNATQSELQLELTAHDEAQPARVPQSSLRHHDRYLVIIYRDNGQGVPGEKKQWIFAPLNTTFPEGSGLGLFIIQKTIEKMDGYIYETGEQGARFEIYLPYLKEDVYGTVKLIP